MAKFVRFHTENKQIETVSTALSGRTDRHTVRCVPQTEYQLTVPNNILPGPLKFNKKWFLLHVKRSFSSFSLFLFHYLLPFSPLPSQSLTRTIENRSVRLAYVLSNRTAPGSNLSSDTTYPDGGLSEHYLKSWQLPSVSFLIHAIQPRLIHW